MTSFVEKILAVHDQLARAGIGHAFGGAIALGFHVEQPRATVDIDLNIEMAPTEALLVLRSLPQGVQWTEADVAQIERDGQTRLFWDRTPVDLFFPQHELHAVVAAGVRTVPFGGARIPIVSATHLTLFKALFNRPKDWVDIDEMLAYGEVDRAEVRGWLVGLLGDEDAVLDRWDGLSG